MHRYRLIIMLLVNLAPMAFGMEKMIELSTVALSSQTKQEFKKTKSYKELMATLTKDDICKNCKRQHYDYDYDKICVLNLKTWLKNNKDRDYSAPILHIIIKAHRDLSIHNFSLLMDYFHPLVGNNHIDVSFNCNKYAYPSIPLEENIDFEENVDFDNDIKKLQQQIADYEQAQEDQKILSSRNRNCCNSVGMYVMHTVKACFNIGYNAGRKYKPNAEFIARYQEIEQEMKEKSSKDT